MNHYENPTPRNIHSDFQTSEFANCLIAEELPQADSGHDVVQAGICIEQIQNWPYVPEEVITDDYIRGFADGKRFVCEALAQYLQLTFPALADEQIKFVFEDVSILNDSLHGPYMDLQLPEWFEWSPDDGGEPMPEPIEEQDITVIPLAV